MSTILPHNCLKSLEDTNQRPIKVCEKCGKLWENYHGVYYRYYENIHDVELWNYAKDDYQQWNNNESLKLRRN